MSRSEPSSRAAERSVRLHASCTGAEEDRSPLSPTSTAPQSGTPMATVATRPAPWEDSQNHPQHHDGFQMTEDENMFWQASTYSFSGGQQDCIEQPIPQPLYGYDSPSHLNHVPQSHTSSYEPTSSSNHPEYTYVNGELSESSCPRTVDITSALDRLTCASNLVDDYRIRSPIHGMPIAHAASPYDLGADQNYFAHGRLPMEDEIMETTEKHHFAGVAPSQMMDGTSDAIMVKAATPDEIALDPDADESNAEREEPYAKLIFRCLTDAPNRTMVLKDIYRWFQDNTEKPKNQNGSKGWQNSIRHNLSMNAAFRKVDQHPADDSRKGGAWQLTEEALRDGVKSTTRYRSKVPNKRARSHAPAPQRQASGAKGGQAAKKAARLRQSERLRMRHPGPPFSPRDAVPPFPGPRPHPAMDATHAAHHPLPYFDPHEAQFGFSNAFGMHGAGTMLEPISEESYPSTPDTMNTTETWNFIPSADHMLFSSCSGSEMSEEPQTPSSVYSMHSPYGGMHLDPSPYMDPNNGLY